VGFNYIDYYLQYTQSAESPTEFFRWSALVTLAAVARDNVYHEHLLKRTYPNLYVVLFAKSGAARKSVPCDIAYKLVREVNNTTCIAGRTSIQYAIKRLSEGFTTEQGTVLSGASGFLYSEELSSFIVKDDATVDLLTTLFDYHEKWESSTITGDTRKLENVCLTLLAGTNDALFAKVYNKDAAYGGLLGRTLIVKGDKARHKNSLMYASGTDLPKTPLVNHLKKVARLRGPMKFSEDAAAYYDKWYTETDFFKHDSETGLEARLQTHVLKVAVLLALADEPIRMEVQKHHVIEAIDLVLELVPNYRLFGSSAGAAPEAMQTAMILQELLRQAGKPVTKRALIRKYFGEINISMFDSIRLTLAEAGLIEVGKDSTGNETLWASQEAINTYITKRKASNG
jgi:hypothetical protein